MKQEVTKVVLDKYDFEHNSICASLAAVHFYQNKLELFALSDCTIYLYLNNHEVKIYTIQGGLRLLDKQVLDRACLLRENYHLDIVDIMRNEEIKQMLISNRLKMNKSDDYWTLSFEPNAVDFGIYELVDIQNIDAILIHTDGFDCIDSEFKEQPTKSVQELYQQLRNIEEKDNKCNEYPRFKVSDDASLIYLKIK